MISDNETFVCVDSTKQWSSTHHVFSDLVLGVKFLQVLLWSLLVRVGTEIGIHKVVHYVVLTDTLHLVTTLSEMYMIYRYMWIDWFQQSSVYSQLGRC